MLMSAADGHIAVEADTGLLQGALQRVAYRANGVMVRRYAVADQAERHRKPVDDCDLDSDIGLLAQGLGGIDAGGPGPDDGDDERFGLGGCSADD